DDLAAFQKKTYDDLMDNASLFGMAALEKAVVDAVFNGDKQIDKSNISITGTMEKTLVHKICADYIGKIIHVHGLTNKTAKVLPMYVEAVFKCMLCQMESPPIPQMSPWALTKPFP